MQARPTDQTRPTDPLQATGTLPSAHRLRAALRANATFSLVSGTSLLLGGAFVAVPWGLGPRWLPPVIGAGVVAFSVLVAWVAVQNASVLRRAAWAVVSADVAWIGATVSLLLIAPPRPAGIALVVALGVAVAGLAGWQLLSLSAISHDDPLDSLEIFEQSRTLPAAPDRIWPLLTDHDLYGRLAPGLSKVEVISAPDQPLRRRCTNTSGNGWEETCTLWEEGRRYAVDVDTSDYPYPLAPMRGLWQVDPHPRGSTVTMRFAYQAHPTITGGIFALAFRPLFPLMLNRILSGWQRWLTT